MAVFVRREHDSMIRRIDVEANPSAAFSQHQNHSSPARVLRVDFEAARGARARFVRHSSGSAPYGAKQYQYCFSQYQPLA